MKTNNIDITDAAMSITPKKAVTFALKALGIYTGARMGMMIGEKTSRCTGFISGIAIAEMNCRGVDAIMTAGVALKNILDIAKEAAEEAAEAAEEIESMEAEGEATEAAEEPVNEGDEVIPETPETQAEQ